MRKLLYFTVSKDDLLDIYIIGNLIIYIILNNMECYAIRII